MQLPKLKKGTVVALMSGCSLLGLAGFGLQHEFDQTDKQKIFINGKNISLSKFYQHVAYDISKKDWRYANQGDTLYFSELSNPLYQYEQHLQSIKRKPLTIVKDTFSVLDTCNNTAAYSLMINNGNPIPKVNGYYLSSQRKITVNVFIPADSNTAQKAHKFFASRNTEKLHTQLHEAQHDKNFIFGITNPAQSPRQLIENMYHDELIAHLKQLLAQCDDYKKSNNLNCFTLAFMKQGLAKKQVDLSYPFSDKTKNFIAQGLIKYIASHPSYIEKSVIRAKETSRWGSSEICVENSKLQNIILNKLYTLPVNGELISFYQHFKSPQLGITQEQIQSVTNAITERDKKAPNMVKYLQQKQNQESKTTFNGRVLLNKMLHQYRNW